MKIYLQQKKEIRNTTDSNYGDEILLIFLNKMGEMSAINTADNLNKS